jgi:putative FmdB family regulatory protein
MPLYEYKCDNCGNVFEAVQKFADPYLTVHEACGGGPVHRLLSVPQLQFKGSGFYITDYARGSAAGSNGPPKKNESGSGAEASSSNSDSGSSSSTPAAATTSSDSKSSSSTTSSTSDKT